MVKCVNVGGVKKEEECGEMNGKNEEEGWGKKKVFKKWTRSSIEAMKALKIMGPCKKRQSSAKNSQTNACEHLWMVSKVSHVSFITE